ncbi:uncharacterized protein LOC133896205 [Phragmites australis]|uniref:uncharacterized protein LOC133896205 n=1 Tax=Phragmites australis TaxID=29695 RepID=UPI002D794541|nr:uncharacterized protein LOC133896205 [Phragmites australis]
MEDEAVDPHPSEVLLDPSVVRLIDEVAEEIERGGAPPLSVTVAKILDGIPACGSTEEWEVARQRAFTAEILRYRAEVEAPAAATVRDRKASRPSAVEKVVVAFSGNDDAAFYREVLEGIEPVLEVADPPGVTSLALRLSWAPGFPLRSRYPSGAVIWSSHHNILVLFVTTYASGLCWPGFYLVYDSWASSVAVIPPLPSWSAYMFSHCSIGTGSAVLRHEAPSNYVLADLLLRQEHGCATNKADLFLWWSSGDCAGRWMQKQVELPLPSEPEKHTSKRTYNFTADAVFAGGWSRLCWVDLLQGVLVCDDVLAACPRFRFIALPEGCFIKHVLRGQPREYRSACCVERPGERVLKFVTMDGHGQDSPISDVTLTTWSLSLDGCRPEWVKGSSVSLGELLTDPTYKDVLGLQPLIPVLSMVQDDVVYLSFAPRRESIHADDRESVDADDRESIDADDLESVDADDIVDVPARGFCMVRLSLDLQRRRVLSAHKLPPESRVIPNPDIFTSDFNTYFNKTSQWCEAQQKLGEDASHSSGEKLPRISDAALMSARPCFSPNTWPRSLGSSYRMGLSELLDGVFCD